MQLSSPRILKFALAGGIAALVNFLSRIALEGTMPYAASIFVAYLAGMATAFLLNRLFVFTGSPNSIGSQAGWFVLINLFAVLQTVLVSLLFARVVFPSISMNFHPETVAHAIGVCVPIVTSYIGHSKLSFRGHS